LAIGHDRRQPAFEFGDHASFSFDRLVRFWTSVIVFAQLALEYRKRIVVVLFQCDVVEGAGRRGRCW